MKFGVIYDFRNPPRKDWHQPWPRFYGAAFEHMQEVERLGYHSISLAEHHGDPDGFNPGLPVTLTAAAHHTSNVRIGTNIIQVPFYHPVLLAEQLAVIDILSGGRLDVGLGQGGFDMEFPMFGVNPQFRPSLLDECIDIMQRCWSDPEPFDYHGKRWNLEGVWINPKPLQTPLPLWVVAAFSQKSMDRVASRGLDAGAIGGMILGLTPGAEGWKRWLTSWQESCVRNGRDPNYARINTFGTCYVTDDPEKAWARHREGLFHSFNYQRQGVHPYSKVFMETIPQKPEDMPGWDRVFQTPDQVIAELRDTYADGAPSELHLVATKAGMSFAESAKYLRNFAEQVMPAVQDL